MKAFFKSNFKYLAFMVIGIIAAIVGKQLFDYAATDAQYKFGEWIGYSGIGVFVLALAGLFLSSGKGDGPAA